MRRPGRLVVPLAALALLIPASASAFRIDPRVAPQPVLRYFVTVPQWRAPFGRVVGVVNRAHVGVRLVRARIQERASIQVGRLVHRCGTPGVDGLTRLLSGGLAAIYLPDGCHGSIGSIVAGHELGHALGLAHENRRCALMNSSEGPDGIPTHCARSRGIDWFHHPYRPDDLAGLRRIYRNASKVAVRVGAN